MLIFDTSTQWLEISEAVHTESWQQCQTAPSPGRWQAYLNQVCLQTILLWLEEKFESHPVIASPAQASFWEMVNGSAITLGRTRLILIPDETMDRNEFCVPQEWIDLPGLVGDYYLAVEVNTDEQALQIWGYSTHAQLKAQGTYDPLDRTYRLEGNDLMHDWAVFWVMHQISAEPTRVAVPPLPDLSAAEAATLLEQLGHSEVILPRLVVPFQQWGGLLQSDRWFQRLCEQRQRPLQSPTVQSQNPSVVRLSQWLQNQFEAGWQVIEEFLSPEPDLAFNLRQEDTQPAVRRLKRIPLGAELPDVVLAIALNPEPDGRIRTGIQILPEQGNAYLPANLQLIMRSNAGAVLQSVEASDQSRYIQLRPFKSSQGTGFRLQIRVADVSVTEDFVM